MAVIPVSQKEARSPGTLLSRSRFWWNHPGHAVVHNQLAVVFSAMLDQAVGDVLERNGMATSASVTICGMPCRPFP